MYIHNLRGKIPFSVLAESVFLDEGEGASGGMSYFANFFINLDQ